MVLKRAVKPMNSSKNKLAKIINVKRTQSALNLATSISRLYGEMVVRKGKKLKFFLSLGCLLIRKREKEKKDLI